MEQALRAKSNTKSIANSSTRWDTLGTNDNSRGWNLYINRCLAVSAREKVITKEAMGCLQNAANFDQNKKDFVHMSIPILTHPSTIQLFAVGGGLKFSFAWLLLSFHLCQNYYCCYVRASCLVHEPWAATAQLSSIVLNNRVGSMVSDDVVNSLA